MSLFLVTIISLADTYCRMARVDLKFNTKGAHAHLSDEVKDLITRVRLPVSLCPHSYLIRS